jgi:hypothetical protein
MFQSLEKSGVYTLPFKNISAIVSDSKRTTLDYSDKATLGHLLVHHQKTIEDLTEKGFNMIIPMRLGTIANSKEEIFKILASGLDLIVETFKKIEDMAEIDVAVTWADFQVLIKEISIHPEITAMKEEIMGKGQAISTNDQVKIGMLLEEKIKEKNKTVELKIQNALSGLSEDIKTHEVMNEQMITNAAYLLKEDNKDKFEEAINHLDEEYNGMLNFKLVGPLPCYSFYTIEVKELSPELISQAKEELGLKDTSSETEIKRAYQEKAKEFHPDVNQGKGSVEHFNRIKKAYQTILEYLDAANFSSKESNISIKNEKELGNLIVVKIKE